MRILVIQHKMIGDVLTTSLLFEILRAQYPKAKLDYLINKSTLAVVDNNPFIDTVWSYEPEFDNDKQARQQFHRQLKNQNYDLVIDVYAKLRSALLTRQLAPGSSVSYHKWYTSFCYKKTIKPARQTKRDEGLAITNRVLLLNTLGLKTDQIPRPKIYLTQEEQFAAKSLLKQAGVYKNKPVFMISAFGSSADKTYPSPYMVKMLDALVSYTGATLLFNYLPGQQSELNGLVAACSGDTQEHCRTDIYGQSLREFLTLAQQCDAVIGNEGGAINMAKALGVPTFSIYAPWILKAAWNSFESSGENVSVHLSDFMPELFTKHPKTYKKNSLEMYGLLAPELINKKLEGFLKHHGFIDSRP